MASLISSTVDTDQDTTPELNRKKRRRSTEDATGRFCSERQRIKRWRTNREQQIYSSKLAEALHRSRRTAREVRQTADRVLAVSASGASRWSRAILTCSQRSAARLMRKHKKARVIGKGRLKEPTRVRRETRRLPAAERKVKVLSRLVPGCRKLSLSNILEEATDYIAALEMQVRAMSALTELIFAGGGSPPPPVVIQAWHLKNRE